MSLQSGFEENVVNDLELGKFIGWKWDAGFGGEIRPLLPIAPDVATHAQGRISDQQSTFAKRLVAITYGEGNIFFAP